jgi:hypothetical protein
MSQPINQHNNNNQNNNQNNQSNNPNTNKISSNKVSGNKIQGINNDAVIIPSEPQQETVSLGSANNNLRILYITFAIIIGLLLIWIIIVVVTKEDPIKVLNDMTDLATQIKPVSDKQILQQQQQQYGNTPPMIINNNIPI